MALIIGLVTPQERQRIQDAGYTVTEQVAGVALAHQEGESPITVIVDCDVIDLLNLDDLVAHVSADQVLNVARSLGIDVDEATAAIIAARVSAHLSEVAEGEIEHALDTLCR